MTTDAQKRECTVPVEEPDGAANGRVYSGLRPEDRALERFGRLVEAGIEVFAAVGYAAAKVKTICTSAGLSERYFYESFSSKEQLLTTVYDHVAQMLMSNILVALRVPGQTLAESVHGGMTAVVNFMMNDPRNAQIILVEIVGVSPELEIKRHESITRFAAESSKLLLKLGGVNPNAMDPEHPEHEELAEVVELARLTGIAMVGGVNNMLLDALLCGTTANTAQITSAAYALICNASTGIRELAGN